MAIIKVICNNLENNPACPHGPTLKFTRVQNNKECTFFACSTYRDRKDCSFYHSLDHKITTEKKLAWNLTQKKVVPDIDFIKCKKRLKKVKKLPPKERGYCHSCDSLLYHSEFINHEAHKLQTNISNFELQHPSRLFQPKSNSKQEAQFFFSDETTQLIVNNLKKLDVNKVLCMGTPRIHEEIQDTGATMESLLLDFDHRYHEFFQSDVFIWFNMFNCYCFGGQSSENVLKKFLSSGKIALLTDPPFGGRVEPLAYTIRKLIQMCKHCSDADALVFWIFPYFMEPKVLSVCPSFTMLDYKVGYENHKDFKNNKKSSKNGSPIRIFSNIEPSKFPLPVSEGYSLCKICNRWVSKENKHCTKCRGCMSKDGQTYIHCDTCGKCVKPTWKHCNICELCSHPDHFCPSQMVNTRDKSHQIPHKKPRNKYLNRV